MARRCVVMVLMQHVTSRVPSTLTQELYVFGAAGLQQRFIVRPCVAEADVAGVNQLVHSLQLGDVVLDDVCQYVNARRDQVTDDDFATLLRCFSVVETVDSALLRELL